MRYRIAIVGGGIAGLATAFWLEHDHGIEDIVVLESSNRPGGKMWSVSDGDHILEWGPQGFLDNAPDTLELVRAAGLGDHLVRASRNSSDRFIVRKGKLRRIPLSPPAFMVSGVLGIGARLRLLGEPFARKGTDDEESVFDFARRRIGKGAASILVDAMVTGIYAGDSTQLSLPATFPKMAAMEAEFGSLTRAMIAKRRAARRTGTASGGPSGPSGTLTTFREGMGELPRTIAQRLGDRLILAAPVRSILRRSGDFLLRGDGFDVTAATVIVAAPAYAASAMLTELAPAAVEPLRSIPTAPITVVMDTFAGRMAFGRPVTGFGFLVPGTEPFGILGCLYCHGIFPGQAPPDHLLLRTMLGGARDPGAFDLTDEATRERVHSVLSRLFGRAATPARSWIIRHPRGIAQYTLGHLDRVQAATAAAEAAGVFLTGSFYYGVSTNDCIREARTTAAKAVATVG